MKNVKLAVIIVVTVGLVTVLALVINSKLHPKTSTGTSTLNAPDLEVAVLSTGKPANFTLYLKGRNQPPQEVSILVEKSTNPEGITRAKPINVEVFENINNKKSKVFSYTGDKPEVTNELADAYVASNFLETGKDVLIVHRRNTAYGSGYRDYLTVIGYYGNPPSAPQDSANFKYQAIEGPTLIELDKYKLENQLGSFLVARAFYSESPNLETHYSPHKYEFFRYSWNWDSFLESPSLGKTNNGYDLSISIDQIISDENLKVGRKL
ncbi:MAG: hypothetical protein NT141_00010 [candidate division WWE3 bacterium]|nr:hypothetical protein [candidate division WWE3 bacterium]